MQIAKGLRYITTIGDDSIMFKKGLSTVEQQSEIQQSTPTTDDKKVLFWTVGIVMGLALLAAFIGTILGANNYMNGPVIYPAWVRTTWFVSDVLLILLILVHIVFFASVSNDNSAAGPVVIGFLAALIGGGMLLYYKHLAWASMFALLVLIGCLIADIVIISKRQTAQE
jgi:hypothetical protein